jgi:site-specific recombinase XerD
VPYSVDHERSSVALAKALLRLTSPFWATQRLNEGMSLELLQTYLVGDANISTTEKVYSHTNTVPLR